jgi:hypothetical protein
MFRNSRHRLITVLFALMSLLFAQLALAGYVCPGSGSNVLEASMPCAESMTMAMDEEQSILCHAHCQAGQQKADTYQMPMLASLPDQGADYLASRILPSPAGAPLQAPLLRRTTAPPLAIRNCCFRI